MLKHAAMWRSFGIVSHHPSGSGELRQASPIHLQSSASVLRPPVQKRLSAVEAAQLPFAMFPWFEASVVALQRQPVWKSTFSMVDFSSLTWWALAYLTPDDIKQDWLYHDAESGRVLAWFMILIPCLRDTKTWKILWIGVHHVNHVADGFFRNDKW